MVCAGAVILALILNQHIGWLNGSEEVLDHVMKHYTVENLQIVSGEYVSSTGEYKCYRVITEDGDHHYIRVNVVYQKNLLQVGPAVRVKSITKIGS